MNPDVQAGFRKGRGTRNQIDSIPWVIKKSKNIPEKNIYFWFMDYVKASDCESQQTGKFLNRWEYQTIPASWEICMQVIKQQSKWDME